MSGFTNSLTILSWNIRQGGGTRIRKIVEFVEKHTPDIATFSEFQNTSTGLALRKMLLDRGYHYQIVSAAVGTQNSVLVASRFPCGSQLFGDKNTPYSDNLVCASLEAFDLFAVYFPHKKKHTLFDVLQSALVRGSIICGDFNTGKNFIDQSGDSFWYTKELRSFEQLGYVDAFRLIHPDQKEYSWFSHQGNGYRYDHTYVHQSFAPLVSDCFYDHDCREDGTSDHSMMILRLTF